MKIQALLLLTSLLFCVNCSVNYGKRVDPQGVSTIFYNGAVGGKGGAVQGEGQDGFYHAAYYDNEKSFRDGVIGLVTYGVADIAGSVGKAAISANKAKHAATTAAQVSNAKTAAQATETAVKADLIKAVGVQGEVPIAPIKLP